MCVTDDEILADESTEVHDLGPDLKSTVCLKRLMKVLWTMILVFHVMVYYQCVLVRRQGVSFFPSNAFMAFARSLHTFNRSRKAEL